VATCPKRVSVVELSTAERVSERGIGFDGRTRERTGNFCWDPSWRGEDGVRLRNATSGVEGAGLCVEIERRGSAAEGWERRK
jgi:hypothetical protein